MDGSEVIVLFLSLGLAAIATGVNRVGGLHRLHFRANPAPGIVRAGVLAAMAWIAFVIYNFADPSVTGVYVLFYLVMGYAAVKLFGQTVPMVYGARTRADVGERRNVPAAIVIAAFTISTGLIFGGSLWGEADPVGDDEGGWWIPVTFFLLGYAALIAAFALFQRRESGSFARRIRRDRSLADARAAASFLLGCAVPITDAVAGDFWGWGHGLLTFGVLVGLLLVHELFASMTHTDGTTRAAPPRDARRILESGVYLAIAGVVWVLTRFLDAFFGAV